MTEVAYTLLMLDSLDLSREVAQLIFERRMLRLRIEYQLLLLSM